jgi:3-oxoacyl-[acyl-carrier-protein] synthase-3
MVAIRSERDLGSNPTEPARELELIQRPSIDFGIFIPGARNQILANDGENGIESWQVRTKEKGAPLTARAIKKVTGVERRHVADSSETTLFMAEAAALHIFPHRGNIPVDTTIVSSTYPIRIAEPNIGQAEALNRELGIAGEAIDFHGACAGTVEALVHLWEHEKQYKGKRILLIASEKHTDKVYDLREKGAAQRDPSLSQLLMSDGAVAMYFVYGEGLTVLAGKTIDLEHRNLIRAPYDRNLLAGNYIEIPDGGVPFWPKMLQKGEEVSDLLEQSIQIPVEELLATANLKPQDISLIIPHQPSLSLLKKLQAKFETMGFSEKQFVIDIQDGNFSSASVPKAMEKSIREGRLKKGDIALCVQLGAGMAISLAVVQL